jgi:hypothetical protein
VISLSNSNNPISDVAVIIVVSLLLFLAMVTGKETLAGQMGRDCISVFIRRVYYFSYHHWVPI